MTEWRLFDGDVPHVSTYEFHEHRPRAAHLEQDHHRERLYTAAQLIRDSALDGLRTFSDLGCGDGGLLSLVQGAFRQAWGYDFQPSNVPGWTQRGVTAQQLDVFGKDRDKVVFGAVVGCTEVLEHLADPHNVLRWIRNGTVDGTLVCSSPVNENADSHDECHAWAWDMRGYADMIKAAGWDIWNHVTAGPFQIVRATA